LILCTDLTLTAEEILLAYNRRWSIEDMFNQMKNRWGWKDTWQQSRQVLHRWAQIIATAYALPQLLAMQDHKQLHELANLAPWRKNHPLTAGRLRLGLQRIFTQVDIRSLWNPKSGKFAPTKGTVRGPHRSEFPIAAFRLNIPVVDYVITGEKLNFYSMRQNRLCDFFNPKKGENALLRYVSLSASRPLPPPTSQGRVDHRHLGLHAGILPATALRSRYRYRILFARHPDPADQNPHYRSGADKKDAAAARR
jgi:hypothetical protein